MLDAEVLDTTNKILETVVTKLWPHEPPKKLYHYAALEKLQKAFEFDDLRLSHAEYSNDQGARHCTVGDVAAAARRVQEIDRKR